MQSLSVRNFCVIWIGEMRQSDGEQHERLTSSRAKVYWRRQEVKSWRKLEEILRQKYQQFCGQSKHLTIVNNDYCGW